MTPAKRQPGGRGSALQSRTSTLARGVLVAALAFSTVYTARFAFGVVTGKISTGDIAKPLAVAALLLGTLTCAEMLALGLNASFLRDRLVARARMRTAYVVLAATAVAAFGLAAAGDPTFAASLAALLLPGAAAFGIITLYTPAYLAKREETARERDRQRAAARAARSGQRSASPPPAKPGRERAQTSTKAKQRRGGRKRR